LAEQAARIGVLADDGRQSSVWRAWVPSQSSDVYVAAQGSMARTSADTWELA